jgi:ABC-type proline/glycine betaine transport system substrate-binding protein
MTKSKIILVWGSEDILGKSIEVLLAAQKDWEVVSISNQADLDALIRSVETAQADIVFIHQGYHNEPTHLPLQLLQAHPAIKVITISLENNVMGVYTKQNILVKRSSDLIGIIENEP